MLTPPPQPPGRQGRGRVWCPFLLRVEGQSLLFSWFPESAIPYHKWMDRLHGSLVLQLKPQPTLGQTWRPSALATGSMSMATVEDSEDVALEVTDGDFGFAARGPGAAMRPEAAMATIEEGDKEGQKLSVSLCHKLNQDLT